MHAVVLKSFPYAHDHHVTASLAEGAVVEIDDGVFEGLLDEGFIREATDEEVEAAQEGPVVLSAEVEIPADWADLQWFKLQALAKALNGGTRSSTRTPPRRSSKPPWPRAPLLPDVLLDLRLDVPPAVQPVTLAQLKAHANVETSDWDGPLQIYLDAAVAWLDGYAGVLGRAMVTQSWILSLDHFPGRHLAGFTGSRAVLAHTSPPAHAQRIHLPLPPLIRSTMWPTSTRRASPRPWPPISMW
jgi:hypothetical protein